MNRNQRLYLFTIRFAAIFSLLLGIGPQIAYADTALPIVDEQGVYLIEVYPLSHQLHVLKHGQRMKTYTVAVGTPSTPTPVGEYKVVTATFRRMVWYH